MSTDTENPELPSSCDGELQKEHEDALRQQCIGDTLIAKTWVLNNLYLALQQANTSGMPDQFTTDVENNLCQLWDAAANVDVADFILSIDGVSILLSAASKSLNDNVRLTELCLGCASNVAAHATNTAELCNSAFISDLSDLLELTDMLCLIQLVRLLTHLPAIWQLLVCHPEDQCNDACLLHKSTFILRSSTNADLLHATGDLVYAMLHEVSTSSDATSHLHLSISSPAERVTLVLAILEAMKEIGFEHTHYHLLSSGLLWSAVALCANCQSCLEATIGHDGLPQLLTLLLKVVQLWCDTAEPGRYCDSLHLLFRISRVPVRLDRSQLAQAVANKLYELEDGEISACLREYVQETRTSTEPPTDLEDIFLATFDYYTIGD